MKRIKEGLGITAVFALCLIGMDYFNGREIDISEVAIAAMFFLMLWALFITIKDFLFRDKK